MGNGILTFANGVTSGIISSVGSLTIETPSWFQPKEMLTGMINGSGILERTEYMDKVVCEEGNGSDSNSQNGKSDSEPNSNKKLPSYTNPMDPKWDGGGNGVPPTNPNNNNKNTASSYNETWSEGKRLFDKFDVEKAYVKPKHLSTAKNSNARFNVSTKAEAEVLLKEAMRNGNILRFDSDGVSVLGYNKYAYFIDAGKTIGMKGEHVIKIVLTTDGGMLTAYPVIWP